MRWTVHGEREIYASEWVRLTLADVELPDGNRFEHHVVRATGEAVGVVVRDPSRGVLLLWRHRFITDTWGWETPAGGVDSGESPEEAAARETLEETGWRPGSLRRVGSYHPTNGLSDQRFHVLLADGAAEVGPPSDPFEAERVKWVPLARVAEAIARGEITDGLSLTSLLWALGPDLYAAG